MAQDRTSHELYQQAHARLGTTLKGKWRLDALIGVGGMAAVYAATHRNGLRVAVKLLHPILSLTSSVHERFRREGYAANNVDHPGVARVLDDDETEEGEPFLVMELLAGETLDTRWRRAGGRMPVGEVLAVAQALLDVLHAAHEAGVLHRDIKPENIFLTADGQLKLLDFGIARMRELAPGGPSVTRTGAMLGTPAFMAPEQARGRSREIDARADVWAVGATLFTILTGRYVHPGETPNEILIKTATEAAPPLLEVVDVPPVVAGIIDRSLAFKADDRFASAAEMREAVLIGLRDLALPWSPPAGEPNARPASFPDVSGATVESAPPCAEPLPEGTPGPALFSVAPPPMSAPLMLPATWRRPAGIAAALAAAALCVAIGRSSHRPLPATPVAVAAAVTAAPAPVLPPPPSPAGVAVETLPVASASPPVTAPPVAAAPAPVSAPRASKPKPSSLSKTRR